MVAGAFLALLGWVRVAGLPWVTGVGVGGTSTVATSKEGGTVAKSSWTPEVDGTGSVVGTGRAKSVLARGSASSEVAVHGY